MDEETLEGFRGDYYFLSNMYEREIEYKGLKFPSSEHLYQWLKVEPSAPDAQKWRDKILSAPHGKKAKFVPKYKGFPFRKVNDLDEFRLKAMKIALWAKFQDPELRKWLLDTDDVALVEHNTWRDDFFGVHNGMGQNHLGRLLMELRMYLRNNLEQKPTQSPSYGM